MMGDMDSHSSSREQDHNESAGDLSPFEKLPLDLHRMIFKRLDDRSFFRVKQSSKQMEYLCERSGHLPTVCLEQMEFDDRYGQAKWPSVVKRGSRFHHFDIFEIPAHSYQIHADRLHVGGWYPRAAARDALRARNVSVKTVFLSRERAWSATPMDFNQLLDDFRVKELHFCGTTNFPNLDSFVCQPAVRKLSCLHITAAHNDVLISPENVLALRVPDLYLKLVNVEAMTVNSYLKEWQEGGREIRSVRFGVVTPDTSNGSAQTRDQCLIDLDHVTEDGSQSNAFEVSRASDHLTLRVRFELSLLECLCIISLT